MRRAALAAIERKLFIHDPNWQRLANRKLMGATNRLPEHPQVTPGQSSRSGVNEIVKIHRRGHNSLSRPGLSSERATEPPGSPIGRQVKRHRRSCENFSYSLFFPADLVIPDAYQKRILFKRSNRSIVSLRSSRSRRSKPCSSKFKVQAFKVTFEGGFRGSSCFNRSITENKTISVQNPQ